MRAQVDRPFLFDAPNRLDSRELTNRVSCEQIHLEHGGTFAGRLTVEELTVNDLGQLAATGVLTGTATSKAGNATSIPPRTVITSASLLDLRGTCTTLVLDVEPIFLEPLRQEVTLGPITLDMHAVPKDEHLLGTTLCALARLQE